MAPISEKRTTTSQKQQQPSDVVVIQTTPAAVVTVLKEGSSALSHHHHNHNHHHQHAKENVTKERRKNGVVAPSTNAKGLEILDFHESWLEEMEVYKDMMHVKKHVPHQLLGSHNHAHTPQGCQIEMVNTHHHHQHQHHHSSANKMSSHPTTPTAASTATNPTKGRTSVGGISNNVANGTTKKRNVNDNKITRVRAANADAIADKEGRSDMTTNGNQLHLKRPREKTPTKTAAGGTTTASSSHHHHHNAKRSGHSSSQSAATAPQPPSSNGPAAQKSPNRATAKVPIIINAASTANNSTNSAPVSASASAFPPVSPKNANAKIIVNQFHASSLLNGHQLEEKEKILTLNGLAKNTSATAYEASFYAANYLNTTDARNNHNNSNGINGMTHPSAKEVSSNYIGVSLANTGIKNGVHEEQADDDDPSSAIDIVVTDTDSDYDEEYTGEPFRLKEDGDESLQSKTKPYVNYTPQSILSPSLFPNVPPYLNYSSHVDPGPSIPPQLRKVLKWKLSPAMPKIVKRVVLNSGFRIIKNTTDWMAVWERHMKSPGFRTIRSHQKYNHMPGSFRIGRKDSMWRSIYENVRKFGKKEFGFMQRSYIMPDELEQLRKAWPKNAARRTKWIVKPPASARGTGISIVNKWSQFPKDVPLVVQKYIERPLLINDNKFDMRIYVVLTSINPLRLYMYKDGLARFASVKYSSELNSLDERCMHLTNYSINKFSENYAKNEDVNACQGHKWTLQSLWSCLEERGVNTKRLWATLRNLVIKALISGEAGLNRMYRQNVNFRYNCFELFGFDVLLDENLVPWLLEINISPSLHSELPLDLHVKGPLIQAVLNTALYQVPPKLSEKQQKDILEELKLKGPLCHDKRIFTTCLRNEEIRKHNQFTNRSIEMREDYLDAILDKLQPDDVRCLMVSEDELNRSSPLERIFPTSQTYPYLRFVDNPRYYNRLLDAWEHRYGHCREKGIELLSKYSEDNYHVIVSDAALEKEPSGPHTEIDVLHVKKDEPKADDDPNSAQLHQPPSIPEKTLSDMEIVKDATTGPPSSQSLTISNATATTNAVAASNDVKLKDSPNSANESKSFRTHTSHTNAKHNKTKSHETTADRKLKTDIKAS